MVDSFTSFNRIVGSEGKLALNKMKAELASELGLDDMGQIDRSKMLASKNKTLGEYTSQRLKEMDERK